MNILFVILRVVPLFKKACRVLANSQSRMSLFDAQIHVLFWPIWVSLLWSLVICMERFKTCILFHQSSCPWPVNTTDLQWPRVCAWSPSKLTICSPVSGGWFPCCHIPGRAAGLVPARSSPVCVVWSLLTQNNYMLQKPAAHWESLFCCAQKHRSTLVPPGLGLPLTAAPTRTRREFRGRWLPLLNPFLFWEGFWKCCGRMLWAGWIMWEKAAPK